ncbi:MAG: methyltransferase domain-containing protein [Pirellulales bacterium]
MRRNSRHFFGLIVSTIIFSTSSVITCVAQEKGDAPAKAASQAGSKSDAGRAENLPDDINRGFLDPNMKPEEYIKRFEIESREVFAQRKAIVDALDLKPGLAVGDIGAGTGLFLKPLSVAVGGSGKVYAVEISPSFVKHLRTRVADEKLENAQIVFCSDREANLSKGSVDRLLICDVYHHFEYPQSTLQSLFSAMRSGGTLVVVDFYRDPDGVSDDRKKWLNGHIRAPLETFRKEIEAEGFVFKDQVKVDGFKENYLIRFTKP